ncbi:hypothetical protein GCM10028808_45810 [Spirosoma migulaei]
MKSFKKIFFLKLFIVCLVIVISIEMVSRFYGLHQYPLFEENADFEYIHKPNQKTVIYRNNFKTNEYSMRSNPLSKTDTLVVLLIGDSILNGTNQVANEDLASTLLENKLKKNFNKYIRVLNVSSFSWGPDNIYAYLKKHGLFNADLIVMINNSGDAYDNMTFLKVLDANPSMPSFNYNSATIKLIDKFIWPAIKSHFHGPIPRNTLSLDKHYSKTFDTGFNDIDTLARNKHTPLMVYLHATTPELRKHSYSKDGQLIINFFKERNRRVILELEYPLNKTFYIDSIHFNKSGQRFMADVLYKPILDSLTRQAKTKTIPNAISPKQ